MDVSPELSTLDGRSVAVIGGGIGGLSSACYLADAGADVTLLERNEQLGGRASVLERDGFRFDMGPSWYLMPDVFERFFSHFDREPSDYYTLSRLDPHYRIIWKDGDTMDLSPNVAENVEQFEAYEEGAGETLLQYLDTSTLNYEVGMEHFVYEDRPRLRDYLDPDVGRQARGLSMLGSMQDHVENYFDHPKLQQVMQYTLVFLGGSPNNTPALYNLMSHVDFNLGVYYPDGGLGAVIDGLVDLGSELGVEYRTGADVTAIHGQRGGFKVDYDRAGESDYAPTGRHADYRVGDDGYALTDLVVSDADYAYTEQELLAPQKRQYDTEYWESRTYAPSAFLLYMGVEGDVPNLAHHTLVLPTAWDEHFEQIFDEPAWPDDPAYYLCVPSKTDETVAPEGHSNLFALVPIAPGLEDDEATRAAYRETVLDDIAANTGTELRDRIVLEETFSVSEFGERYNSMEGSALGLAHTLKQTALLRPSRTSEAVPGLYFTGSYTTPGIGVPMCLISGQLTAEALTEQEAGRTPPGPR
jgi:phytoene desaturase